MSNVGYVEQSQKINEQEYLDQIAGAGAAPTYLVSEEIGINGTESVDSAEISGPPLASTSANAALTSATVISTEEEVYLDNSNRYHRALRTTVELFDADKVKLQDGSEKIDGDNEDVQELLDQILEEAGLSEKPAGMTDEEYQQAVAEAIYNWLLENWQYVADQDGDYWQSVAESLGLSGDCEDFAILLASLLVAAGIDPSSVAVIVNAEGDHAYVAVEIGGKVYTYDGGNITETSYGSLEELCADASRVGAWFTQDAHGINNPNLKIDTADDTAGSGGVNGSEGSSGGGQGDALDAVNNLDGQATDDVLNFNDEDYMIDSDGDGYLEPDTAALFEWQKRIMARANALAALLIALANPSECRKIVDENFSGEPIEEVKDSYKQAYARKIGFLMKMVRTAITKLFEQINTRNQQLYQERMEEIKENNEGSGADTENFFTGGAREIETAEMQLDETCKYLESTKSTLAAMQQMINALIQWLVDTMGPDGDFASLGTISQLRKFSARLDELNTEVDRKLEEVRQEMADLPDASAYGWLSFFTFNIITLVIDIIVLNCSDELDYADKAEYMTDVDIEQMISEYRGTMVAMQNAQRGVLSLQLFRKDLYNTVRQEITGLSGIGTNAEMLMHSAESTMGLSLSVFDMTASQMMLKTQLHNNAVKLVKGSAQLRKAQPIRLLSLALTIVIIVLSIVVTALTFGSGSATIPLAIMAGVVLVKAGVDTAATYVANDVDSYEPAGADYDPAGTDYDPATGRRREGNSVLDAFDQLENAQEANMGDSSSSSLLGQSKDEYYFFDSIRFAAYEAKQKILDNLTRMLFSAMKNARDLRRVVRAEITGRSTVDSGQALLQNAVENVLMQRQVIMSAIKFQHSEVVTAKNIAKQRELGCDRAWGNFGANLIGAAVGFVAGLLLGGGNVAMALVGMSIGSTLASNIYQVIQAESDRFYDMDIDSSAKRQLEKLLQRQGEKSLEAKLDQAELKAYQDMLANGIASAGDGYSAVNFGLITEVYARLGRIYAAKEALIKMRAMASELRSIVKQEMSGISLGKSGDLALAVNTANFRNAMSIAGSITRFLDQRVQVLNRANQAAKQRTTAWVTFGINAAIAIVSFGCMGSSSATVAALASVGPGLMSLVNSTASFINSMIAATADLGDYEKYNAKQHADQAGKVTNNAQRVDDALAQKKYELMMEMNSGLITDLGGGFYSVSASSADIVSGMQGVFRAEEALATARSIISAVRDEVKSRMTGKRQGEVTFGKESIETYEQIAMNVLESMKSALQSIASRQSQIASATRQAVVSGIQSAISLAIVILSTANAFKKGDLAEMQKTNQGTNAQTGAYNQPGQLVDTPSSPAEPADAASGEAGSQPQPAAGAVVGTPATGGAATEVSSAVAQTTTAESAPEARSQAGEVTDRRAPTSDGADNTKTFMELQDDVAAMSKWIAGLKLANVVLSLLDVTVIQGLQYSERDHSRDIKDKNPEGKAEKSSNQQAGSVFSSMDSMDASINNSNYVNADIANHAEQHAQMLMRHEQLMLNVIQLLQEVPSFVGSMRDQRESGVYLQQFGSMVRASAMDPNTSTSRVAGLIAELPTEAERNTAISEIEQLPDRQRAMAILEDVQRRLGDGDAMAGSQQRVSLAIESVRASEAAATAHVQAQPPVQAAAPITPPSQATPTSRTEALLAQADQLLAQRQQLLEEAPEAIEQLEQQITETEEQAAEVQAQTGQVQQAVNANQPINYQAVLASLEATPEEIARIDTPQEMLEFLEAKRAELQAEWSQLTVARQQLEIRVREIRTGTETMRGEAQGQVEALGAQIAEVRSQMAAGTISQENGQARIQGLQQQQSMWQNVLNHDLFGQQEQQEMQGIQDQLTAINGRISNIRQQLVSVQGAIQNMREEIARQQSAEADAAAAPTSALETGSAGVTVASLFDNDQADDDQERIEDEGRTAQAGEVLRGPTTDDALLAIARAGHGAGRNYYEQYQDATDAERAFRDSGAVSGVVGAGVA